MSAFEWTLLFTFALLWGAAFFFYKVLNTELPMFTIVLSRVLLAALVLVPVAHFGGVSLRAIASRWREFLVMALLNNVVPFSLIVFSETRIASGLAAILNATTPIFTVLVAHFLTTDEKFNLRKAAAVMLGFMGVVILIGPGLLGRLGVHDAIAQGACLVAAGSYALAAIYGRRFKGMPSLGVAAGQVTASTALLLPVTIFVEQPWLLPTPSTAVIGAVLGLAIPSTALAYLIYFRLLRTAGPTNLLLVTLLSPVSTLMLGALFLGEGISAQTLCGLAVIATGLGVMDGRPIAAARRLISARA